MSIGTWKTEIKPILYRPFDLRTTIYNRNVPVHRRERVMKYMLGGKNIGLATARKLDVSGWEHVFCSKELIQHHTVSLKEVNFLFPLYLYPQENLVGNQSKLFSTSPCPPGKDGRTPNLNPDFVKEFSEKLGLVFVSDIWETFEKPSGLNPSSITLMLSSIVLTCPQF